MILEAAALRQPGQTVRWIVSLWRAGAFLRPELMRIRGRILIEAGLILVLSLLGFVAPLLSQYAIDSIIMAKDASHLANFLWVTIAFLAVSLAVRIIAARLQAVTRVRFAQGVRTALVDKVARVDAAQSEAFKPGDYIYRLVDDAMAIAEPIISIHTASVTAIITFLVAVVLLVSISYELCLVVLGGVFAGFIVYQAFKPRLQRCAKEEKLRHQAAVTEATNFFAHLQPIRLLACFEETTGCVNRAIWSHGIANINTRFLGAWSNSLGELLRSMFHLGLVGYGSFLVIRNEMTLGALIAFMAIAAYATSPIQYLTSAFLGMQPAMISVARIGQVMDIPQQPAMGGHPPPSGSKLALEIRDLCIGKEGRTVLRCGRLDTILPDISAIIGPNGAGKSTFAKIIAGVERRFDGSVLINGGDVRTIEGSHWVRLVTPDCFFANDSLKRNLLLGSANQQVDDPELDAALATTFGSSLATLFPDGLSTRIERYGEALSTGEKCRINCARAIIRRPALVILDDVLHNIDADAATRIVGVLARESHVIIISSRESDGALARSVIALHDGLISAPEPTALAN